MSLIDLTLQEGGQGFQRVDLANMANRLGWLHWREGALSKATEAFLRARAVVTAELKARPNTLWAQTLLGYVCDNLGLVANDMGSPQEAIGWFDQSVKQLERVREVTGRDLQKEGVLRSAYWGRAEAYRLLGRDRESLLDFDRTVRLRGSERLEPILAERAAVMARLGRYEEAAAAAERVAKRKGIDGLTLLSLARATANCSAAVQQDRTLSKAERGRRAEDYAKRAVALLERANNARAFTRPKPLRRLTNDSDLQPLRSREDYKALLTRIKR